MDRKRWMRHRPLFSSQVPLSVQKPKIKWSFWAILWLAITRTCMVVGAFVLICAGFVFFSVSQVGQTVEKPLPKKMVLYLEFMDGFQEAAAASGFAESLGLAPPTVHEIVDAIDLAAKDDRVQGIMARMDGGSFSPAQTKEVRDALKRFQASGKFTKIYSASYGEAGGGLGRFYLASVFLERWMQPLGVVAISGVNAEMPFLRDTLDKIGVKPEFFKRKDYKTAYENLTDREMSTYNRQEIESLVTDLRVELVKDISADLGMTAQHFEALVNKGLFTAPEALQEKLISESSYVDILVSQITADVTGNPESEEEIFVDPLSYLDALGREKSEKNLVSGKFAAKPEIAVVYVTGAIMDSRISASGAPVGLTDEGIAAADEIAPALLQAADDPNIRAVVLRVDSPGGSPVASETILRAVEKVQEKGKHVIVSMGSTAASGGYWVAAYGDRIFAQATTITGSIGVVGGKFSAAELWTKLGVNWDGVKWGENSGMWSINTPFSEAEAERMNAMLDMVYSSFLARVAKGRKMGMTEVDKIAGGRVWSGTGALDVGLVDEIGGLAQALDYAAKQIGAEDRFGVDIVVLPEPLTPLEELMALFAEQGMVYEGLKLQGRLGHILSPVFQELSVMQGSPYFSYEPLRVR